MAGADRISGLHDSILTHILSYLPTKEAVRTQRLSKRWRNVWAYVPVLNFNIADFDENSEYDVKFVKFIDAVFASRQVQLVDRFRLVYKKKFSLDDYNLPLKKWIRHFAQQCPRVLSIFLQRTLYSSEIHDMIFTCLSLKEIEFQDPNYEWHRPLNPTLVTLPHLRKLNLGHFRIEDDFMDKLLLGCPSLDELELYACRLDISQISCCNLKSLVINCCRHATEIEVSIPSLQYLKVTVLSCQTGGYIFNNMSSLVKASICLFTIDDLEMLILNSEAKILAGLSGLTTLDFVLYGLHAKDMLEHILKTCPYFDNLKFMHFESFDGCMAGCIDMVSHLVQHATGLKELTFYRCQDDSDKIKLLDELREVLGKYGIARLVECNQGCIYGSLSELEELLDDYLRYFERITAQEEAAEEDEGEGSSADEGDEEEDDEVEASLAEEEEEGEDEADEYVGGAMEEGEETEEEAEYMDQEEEEEEDT